MISVSPHQFFIGLQLKNGVNALVFMERTPDPPILNTPHSCTGQRRSTGFGEHSTAPLTCTARNCKGKNRMSKRVLARTPRNHSTPACSSHKDHRENVCTHAGSERNKGSEDILVAVVLDAAP